jgi:hypothetical protein
MAAIIFKALPQFGQRQSAQDFPRSWPTAVGGGRFRSGWQRPATGSLGPAPTGLRIRPAHRLVGRCPNEPPWLVAGLLVPWHVVLPGRALLAARCTQGHPPWNGVGQGAAHTAQNRRLTSAIKPKIPGPVRLNFLSFKVRRARTATDDSSIAQQRSVRCGMGSKQKR